MNTTGYAPSYSPKHERSQDGREPTPHNSSNARTRAATILQEHHYPNLANADHVCVRQGKHMRVIAKD